MSNLELSKERFQAVYHVEGSHEEASARARDICLEQTVEFPQDLIERDDIREQIFGRVVSFEQLASDRYETVIEFPVETTGMELPQFLNVLFGNISIKPGIRLVRFMLSPSLADAFRGPRFGRDGLRALLDVRDRPVLCTAVKPMGLSGKDLADLAYKFALGGIDMIKDDHGLSDQTFCRFDDRVKRCCEAVQKACEKTNRRCLYFPNITAPGNEIMERARVAVEAGAGGLVISPGLTGLDAMRRLADDDSIALPIMSHPALMGSFTVNPNQGIAHGALYGQINRMAGADACIFPSFGGRFSFTEDECRDIVDGSERHMGEIKSIFPVPAGGMSLDRVPELIRFYGTDIVLLIGGDLHRHGPDLVENCRAFVRSLSPTKSINSSN